MQRKLLGVCTVPLIVASLAGCAIQHTGLATDQNGILPQVVAAKKKIDVGKYIKHVVIIVQENRSFNAFFAGYPGAYSKEFGYEHNGTRVRLHRIRLADVLTFNHEYDQAWQAYDGGKMDAFDLNDFSSDNEPVGKAPYAFVKRSDIAPYWAMAHQYVLLDRMFPTMLSSSFTAHLDLIAGTSDLNPDLAVVDQPDNGSPWGCYSPAGTNTPTINSQKQFGTGPFPCYTQFRTMADTLDAAGVSWKYYAPQTSDLGGVLWTEFASISNVYNGPDWAKDIITPQTRVLTDIGNGQLASVTWAMPDWVDSDHSWNGSDTGPSWVSSIVNAVGESPYWKSTAIFVLWDDWGGFFDPAVPPQLDFRGLGIRVPCLIISSYAKKNYVDHTQYEFGTILRFVEDAFRLPLLGSQANGYTDARAASPLNAFDFSQQPRKFTLFTAKYSRMHFLHERPSLKPVDTQ